MKKTLAIAIALFAFGCVVGHLVGCVSPQVKEDAAISAYGTAQLRCVDAYDTKLEIDACRRRVRAQWGIAETVKDAGGDQ